MAYKKQEIINKCYEIIEGESIVYIEELVAFLPISKRTFYQWNLHKLQELRDELENSKIKQKSYQRKMWEQSDNPTLQLASYRLKCTDDEHRKLSTNYTPSAESEQQTLKYEVKITK